MEHGRKQQRGRQQHDIDRIAEVAHRPAHADDRPHPHANAAQREQAATQGNRDNVNLAYLAVIFDQFEASARPIWPLVFDSLLGAIHSFATNQLSSKAPIENMTSPGTRIQTRISINGCDMNSAERAYQ